ncbi:MAG: hypothetical protein V4568_18035 [Pseudomonadota bacterium]
MALNLPNFMNAPIQKRDYSGLTNLPAQLLAAYQAPEKMDRADEDRRLKNELLKAQTKHHNMAGMSDLEKNFGLQERILEEEGEDSPKYQYIRDYLQNKLKSDKGLTPSNLAKLQAERAQIAQEGNPNDPRLAEYDAAIKKLGPKEESGVTNQTKTKQQNALLANDVRDYLSKKNEMPTDYIGFGGSKKMEADRREYKRTKDPVRKKELFTKLAKVANARKMAYEYAVFQLEAQGGNKTKYAIAEQEKAVTQGWPWALDGEIALFPKEIQEEANKIHAREIDKLTKIRTKSFEKMQKGEFGKAEQAEEESENMSPPMPTVLKNLGYNMEDLEHTAQEEGKTVEEIIQILEDYERKKNG